VAARFVADDQMLFLLLTMALTGLVTVLGWDAMFVDRRDAHVLGVAPVSTRDLVQAKLAAVGFYFVLILAVIQAFQTLALPPLFFPDQWLRALGAQVLVLTAASAFVFFGAMALNGLLLLVLPYALFQQVSAALQLVFVFSSFGVMFLTPKPSAATSLGLAWVDRLPPYWFHDLWRGLMGRPGAFTPSHASWAICATLAAVGSAVAILSLGYRRAMRRVVEGREARKGRVPSLLARAVKAVAAATVLRDPRQRAVFLFTWRTFLRHRNHRLLLAIYFGFGLSWVLSGLARLLDGSQHASRRPDELTVTVPLELAFFLLAGMKVLFSIPIELKSNWVFQLSARERDSAALDGIWKFLFLTAVLPLAAASLPIYGFAWGWTPAWILTGLFLLQGLFLIEIMLHDFQKIPFTCSWQPGKGNLHVKAPRYFILFMGVTATVGAIEAHWLRLEYYRGLIPLTVIVGGLWIWYLVRRLMDRREAWRIEFEESPDVVVNTLGLAP
jgi:hypothetical protein